MGNSESIQKVNFEDIQTIIKNPANYIVINTLDKHNQSCLIKNTTNIDNEEILINENLKNKKMKIVIYGKNSSDDLIYKKYKQLLMIGNNNLFVYTGGLFEWLCLQDIYGFDEFPTTSKELDILKYKSKTII